MSHDKLICLFIGCDKLKYKKKYIKTISRNLM